MKSIGIIGAGLMGRVVAINAINNGYQTTLFEKKDLSILDSASRTAAGMISPIAEVENESPKFYEWGKYSLSRWSDICSQINMKDGFYRNGSLLVYFKQDQASFDDFDREVNSKLQLSKDEFLYLNSTDLSNIEPQLNSEFCSGIFLPNEAHICCDTFIQHSTTFLKNNLYNLFEKVEAYSENDEYIHCAGQNFNFDWIVDCRGLEAQNNIENLHGIRGETIHLYCKDVCLNRPVRLMHPRYQIYIVPRKDHKFVIGATSIISEDFSNISVQSTLELLSAAYSVSPSFAEARILESRVNCRPTLSHHMPTIQRRHQTIYVNGLYRHGYLLAPFLGDQLFDIIRTGTSKLYENYH